MDTGHESEIAAPNEWLRQGSTRVDRPGPERRRSVVISALERLIPYVRDRRVEGAGAASSALIGTLVGVATHTLAWPARAAIGFGVMALASTGLRLVVAQLGVARVAANEDRVLGTFIGALLCAFVLSALVWSILGRDPGATVILVGFAVLAPAWWVILGWWRRTSPSWTGEE